MEVKLPVNNYNIYKAIVLLLNFKYQLSELEVDLLATILKYDFDKIDGDARDLIRKALDKNQYSINNYIKRLRSKDFLVEVNKKTFVNPNLKKYIKSIVESKELNFKFVTNN